MKKSHFFLLFLFLGISSFAYETEKLPKKPCIEIVEKQFKEGVLQKIEDAKTVNRDRNLWWVQNPAAVIILPLLILVLFFIFLIIKLKSLVDSKINKKWLQFVVLALITMFFADILIILCVSFYDFLTIPDNYQKVPFVRYDTVITTLVFSIISFPILCLFRFIELKIQKISNSIFTKTFLIFLSTGFLPFMVVSLFIALTLYKSNNIYQEQESYSRLAIIFLLLMIIASIRALISFFIFKERSLIVENEKQLSYLRELNAKAELKSLQSQINPHFLYNSLNSIASLAPINSVKTQKMAHSLSDLFKYSINRKGKKMSTIKDEIDMVKTYLDIEKIRFGDRLQFKIQVDKTLENLEIPLFLIQPLVENAVKHGISQNEGEGKIVLKIKKEANNVVISVSDNGPNFPEGLVSGHGLQTVYDLLRLTFGDQAALNWTNTPEKTITITIPETI